MKLANMKIDPKEREKKYAPSTIASDAPIYPWGLSINLDDDALEKLGLTAMPKVGVPLMLYAQVDVTGCSENENNSGVRRSLTLQITDMGLEAVKDGKDAAEVLYGGKG